LPDTDVVMTSLQYFVCCTTDFFQLWRQTYGSELNNVQATHPLTIHDSKQETQLSNDKEGDAFRGQSRSSHMYHSIC